MARRKVSKEVATKFLLGRKMDEDRANLLLNNYQRTVLLRHFENITIADVKRQLDTGLMYVPGTKDRNGAHLVVLDATKHDPARFTADDTMRTAFFMGEQATARPTSWDSGLTLIVIMRGFQWSQWDLALQKSILELFTNNIPARVKNILLFDPPWWISTLVRIVSPFMKEKMRARMQIVDEASIRTFIERDQIPDVLGGHHHHDQEAYIDRCIENGVGREQLHKALHQDEQGREITVLPLDEIESLLGVGPGHTKLSPGQQQEVDAERTELLANIDARMTALESYRDHEITVRSLDELVHLYPDAKGRIRIDAKDWSAALNNRPQPNQKDEADRTPFDETSADDYGDPAAMKARMKRDIERNMAVARGEPVPEPEAPEAAPRTPDELQQQHETRRRRGGGKRRPVELQSPPAALEPLPAGAADEASDGAAAPAVEAKDPQPAAAAIAPIAFARPRPPAAAAPAPPATDSGSLAAAPAPTPAPTERPATEAAATPAAENPAEDTEPTKDQRSYDLQRSSLDSIQELLEENPEFGALGPGIMKRKDRKQRKRPQERPVASPIPSVSVGQVSPAIVEPVSPAIGDPAPPAVAAARPSEAFTGVHTGPTSARPVAKPSETLAAPQTAPVSTPPVAKPADAPAGSPAGPVRSPKVAARELDIDLSSDEEVKRMRRPRRKVERPAAVSPQDTALAVESEPVDPSLTDSTVALSEPRKRRQRHNDDSVAKKNRQAHIDRGADGL